LTEETIIALRNFEWLLEHREVALDFDTETLIVGDGGVPLDTLCEPGFTPATRAEA
jgi:hypothetical protein